MAHAALARNAIDRRRQRLCRGCEPRAATDGRPVVLVPATFCSLCGGSNNARAVAEMTAACRRAGIGRLLVVGGSPNMRAELEELVAGELELRLVDGTKSQSRPFAQGNIAWADLIVVLGATQLAPKISTLYTRDPDARRKLVTTSRHGLEAIAGDVVRSDLLLGAAGAGRKAGPRRA